MDITMIKTKTIRSNSLPWRVRVYYRCGQFMIHARPNQYAAQRDAYVIIDKYIVSHIDGHAIGSYRKLELAEKGCNMLNELLPPRLLEFTRDYSEDLKFIPNIMRHVLKETDGIMV